MSSTFANRRKPRKIGGDDEEEDGGSAPEPVVKRPTKSKPKSKLRMSFNAGGTSMAGEEDEPSEVVIPKRLGLGRKAVERSAAQRNQLPLSDAEKLSERFGRDQDRPSYSSDYIKELRDSTPSTPKLTDDEKDKTVDVAAKFGELMTVSGQSAIPSAAEIREKKARRARLAMEHTANSTEEDFMSLDAGAVSDDDWDAIARGEKVAEKEKDTRLVRDDEDFAEGFEEYVEDGKISLGKKAEREQKRKQREAMRELIDDAEGPSDEEDSDVEEKAAYEATQTKAAIGQKSDIDRPRTPPKMTSLPRLASSFDRLRTSLASMENAKTQMISRMEDLRKEKADIAIREVEIQGMIKEAGDNYERLKKEAGIAATNGDASAGALEKSRGLESIGAPLPASDSSSDVS
ncbi:hypothetical protein N7504_009004 [Penicillium tannophilum]|nr:hypothetical protein N7504_009004 [Penicillium tannophilum]